MKNKKEILSFGLVVIFFLAGFFLINNNIHPTPSPLPFARGGVGERSEDIKSMQIAGQSIKVDLAVTSAQQEKGLSGRSELGENEGMLFVFDQPGKYPFWMKDMNFPIDIIWVGEDMKVVYIEKNATPESYPETFGGNNDAKYVLEVPAGFSDKNNLKVGDSASFTY